MDAITRGDPLWLRNAYGEWVSGRALSGIVIGGRDALVWVCATDEWEAFKDLDYTEGTPWPLDAVQIETNDSIATTA